MFAGVLYGSTDCYYLSQLNDCGAIIKVRRNHVRLCWGRIVETIWRRNIVHLFRKNDCSCEKASAMLVKIVYFLFKVNQETPNSSFTQVQCASSKIDGILLF